MEDQLRVFPAQVDFRVASIDGGPSRLQFRQVAPKVIQLAGVPSWGWSEWQDILIVEQGDENERKDADEADERPDAQKNADETRETLLI